MKFDVELIQDFATNCSVSFDSLEKELTKLENDLSNEQSLMEIYRHFHTFKGSCGFVGLSKGETIAHAVEDLVNQACLKKKPLTNDIVRVLIEVVGVIRKMVDHLKDNACEDSEDYSSLLKKITEYVEANAEQIGGNVTKTDNAPKSKDRFGLIELKIVADIISDVNDLQNQSGEDYTELISALKDYVQEGANHIDLNHEASEEEIADLIDPHDKIGAVIVRKGYASVHAIQDALRAQSMGDPRMLGEILVDRGAITSNELVDILFELKTINASDEVQGVLKINGSVIEDTMYLIRKEITLLHQMKQVSHKTKNDDLMKKSKDALDNLLSIHENLVKCRLQPVGDVLDKLPRLARDVAKETGKKVELEIEGRGVEIDRKNADLLLDAMVHIVRNAIYHGIEAPDVREKLGKDAQGTVHIMAKRYNRYAHVIICDDGAGLNFEAIRKKAIELKLVNETQAEKLSDQELTALIFKPGLSTANKVSKISGRGIGMDIVKNMIEKAHADIEVESIAGQGTTIVIKIPLSIESTEIMTILSGERYFAVPVESLCYGNHGTNVITIEPEMIEQGYIEYQKGGNIAPIIRMQDLLGIQELDLSEFNLRGSVHFIHQEPINKKAVLLKSGIQVFALIVEGASDLSKVVFSPLTDDFKSIGIYKAYTVLNNGEDALVIDVDQLWNAVIKSGIFSNKREKKDRW